MEFLHDGHRTQQQKQADEPQQHAATGANELAQEAHDEKAAQLPKAPNTAPILCLKTQKIFCDQKGKLVCCDSTLSIWL